MLKYTCQLTQTITVKRYSLIGCIDLFTRRALLLLSDTSKAEAICQLLATAMTKWGVPEEVRTDRGKEYLSRRVQRFLENLSVRTSRCLPRHPEQKAFIERFIHTFQHRDLPKLPGFVGHSVTDRQALRSHPDWQETAIELLMTPEEFQTWAEAWIVAYEQRPHGRVGIGLEGKSPLEVLESAIAQGWQKQQIRNSRELDFLMMAAPTKDGMRRVGRQGISLNGRLYIAGELGDWIGKRVYVCFSPQDLVQIHVYQSPTLKEYICQAVWREAGQINLAQFAKQARLVYELLKQEVKQSRKRGQALLHKIAREPMSLLGQVQEVLPSVQSQLYNYPALSAIAQAIASTEPQDTQLQISPEQYQAELAKLEASEAERLAGQQQAIALNQQLEQLFEAWQSGADVTEISSQSLSDVRHYLETSPGKGYLAALTNSKQEEQRFCAWLTGDRSTQVTAIEPNQLLQAVFQQWKQGLEVLLSEREFVAHYIQLPAGKGTLSALAEDRQEQQDFYQWLSQPEIAATIYHKR
ncbi:Mu transposase C-terminal domain-containing protein [Chroococcidiopsis thermalis]|uniref:Mu transposase C-terminal domain-containing protein n=1 Tax=Chroococcidiopsis thermalis TaxID=54299 RepID=UPI00059BBD4C|nr:Mu transposase C-terminal domain-containing protein [Chroococcidiopsis thermalis]